MSTRTKRVRLSFLAAKTQKMLFWFLSALVLILSCVYLFWLNHLSMQGYILSHITAEGHDISAEVERLDARIAKLQTREYIAKMSESETSPMVLRQRQRFVVVRDVFTAQK